MNKDAVAEMSQQYQVETAEKLVPEGYKQTEVGVIPEDWEVCELQDVCGEFKTGKLDANAMRLHGEYRFYTCAREHYYIDHYAFDTEALLISGNGANVGYVHYYKGKFNAYQRTYVLYDFSAIVGYLKIYLERKLAERIRVEVNAGNTPYITMDTLTEMPIALPRNKYEQAAIANALSDTDALLSELEKLIAKKQAIKTATMQQLLTGRTRLPQFAHHPDGSKKGYKQSELGQIPEDWGIKGIGQLCNYQNGTAQEEHFNPHDGYKVVSIGNYSESGRYIDTSNYIGKYLKPRIDRFILNKGDLAMILNDKTSVGTIIGRVIHIDADDSYVMNQRTMRLSTKGEVSSTYLHFLINSDFTHKRIVGMAKPGTQIYINTDDVLTFQLQFPVDRDEQTAIATILSDMDEEIQALEQRLNKTRQIKQGMMQQLLTGKIRLV